MEKLSIFIRGEAFLPDISRRYERVGRKVLTIDRCTQKKWVPDGRRSKRFTLQIYEKQRVRASSPCILFPYRPKQKHADAFCIGVTGNKRAASPSVLHPKAQRRGQTVEHMHQAVERRHALPQTKGRHRAANQHTTRGIGGSVAGVDQNPLASRHLHQARQPRPPAADHRRGERAKRGETTSSRSGYSPAGMAGCTPDAGGSSVAMGDCPLSAGKNSTPSVPPGRWAVRRKRISVDIRKK